MWESPIDAKYGEVIKSFEDDVVKAVQKVGINVDKDELIKALSYDRNQYERGYNDGFWAAVHDGAAVKHGRWIRPEGYCWRPECSECGYYGSAIDEPVIPFNYCPNCGAKMDLEET